MVSSTVIYLYCIVNSDFIPQIKTPGVDGIETPFVYNFTNIGVVVSMVSSENFCGPSAESHMQDLSWIGPRVFRHEQVIEEVMLSSSVLPAPFGTLFYSMNSIEKFIEKHSSAILRFFEEVRDKEEWALLGLINRSKVKEGLFSTSLAREEQRLATLSPGVRYFHEKKIQAEVEKSLNLWLKETCEKATNEVNRYAIQFCERKTFSRCGVDSDLEMVMNWAYLVPKTAIHDLQEQVNKMNTELVLQGLKFELTGPWPPYSFCPSLKK